jgi:Xaa-Pro aminopeptidase
MLPYDGDKLDRLMDEAGLDLVLATTRHNVRYLTGGYYFHFHSRAQRMGRTQYLPLVGVPHRDPAGAFYIFRGGEEGDMAVHDLWIEDRVEAARGTVGTAEAAVKAVDKRGLANGRIGVEMPFLPADAFQTLQQRLPNATLVDATNVLDELRAIKRPEEIELVRRASAITADAIQAAFQAGYPGVTTEQLADQVRLEMEREGLTFLWCFTNAGPDMLRAPSSRAWQLGQALHLDAGGEISDYLADLCRMACLGEPSPLLIDLHAACLAAQESVRPLLRPGTPASEVHRAGMETVARSPFNQYGHFTAHGVGMVSHEQPVIDERTRRPLEAGMVLSIETDIRHPEVGHVKIEDSIAITPDGYEALGDTGRQLQVIG